MKNQNNNNSIINWYDIIGDTIKKPRYDKKFKQHHILPTSMILSIGGTGSGKTNALLTFISLKNESFYNLLILYTGSTSEEPLYEF